MGSIVALYLKRSGLKGQHINFDRLTWNWTQSTIGTSSILFLLVPNGDSVLNFGARAVISASAKLKNIVFAEYTANKNEQTTSLIQ